MKRIIILLALALLAAPAAAKVYYINKGVQYHIGDNRYSKSTDKEFVGTYPVVGQEWVQAFRVSEDDKVWVRIEKIRGVDDCPYCKIIISINEFDMGRLFQENNKKPFFTPEPLAKEVKRGETYLLKIASYGDERVDDFVISNVVVESAKADIILLKPGPVLKMPGEPMPVFADAPRPAPEVPNTCPGVKVKQAWALGLGQQRDSLTLQKGTDAFAVSENMGHLRPGEAVEFYMRVDDVNDGGDEVSHALEVLLDGDDKPSGWVLSFDQLSGAFSHGNLIKAGNYRAKRFRDASYLAGDWNRIRVSRCKDGTARMAVNGVEVNLDFKPRQTSSPLLFRVTGLQASLAGTHKF